MTAPLTESELKALREKALKAIQRPLSLESNSDFLHAVDCNTVLRLLDMIEELKGELSKLALKHGGKHAAHVYGLANCRLCGQLSQDYYLIGESQICLSCYEKFPAQIEARDRAIEVMMLALANIVAAVDDDNNTGTEDCVLNWGRNAVGEAQRLLSGEGK